MKKKIFSMILMLCMVITLFPAAVLAANGGLSFLIKCSGENIFCSFTFLTDAESGKPGTLAVKNWNTDPNSAATAIDKNKKGDAIIPSTFHDNSTNMDYVITEIGADAFSGCSLTSITIPETVISIGSSAFYACQYLTSLTIPKNVTQIGANAFMNCVRLKTITFEGNAPTLDSGVFDLLTNFKIKIPDGATGYSGGSWDALQDNILKELVFTDQAKYDIPASTIDTAITPIDVSAGVNGGYNPYTFTASGLPAGITINSAGTISGTPTAAGNAGTATITVTDSNTPAASASITIQYGAVTAKVVPHTHNYNETVWKTDAASHWHECTVPNCTALKKDLAAHTPGEWIVDKAATTAETGKRHKECTVCKAMTAEETIPAIPETIQAFTSGSYKYAVTSADGAKTATVELTGLVLGKSTSKVTVKKTVTYQGKTYNITGIADKAFYKNKNIKEINIGSNVTTIGKKAFYDCRKLTNVVLGNKVTKIDDNAFYKCTGLKKVTIGTGLKTIGEHAFCRDKKLSSITIKSTKLTKVGRHNLYQCRNLKIRVPSSKVKAYSKFFKNQGQNSNVKVTK